MVCDKPQPAHPYSCFPGRGTRVELRSPDPAANPYLALAVCLAAGIDGIRNKIEPPEEVPENVYELKEEEKQAEESSRFRPIFMRPSVNCRKMLL